MRALPEKDAMALSRTGSDPKRFLPYTGSFQKKSSPSFYDPKYWAVEPDHLEYPEGVIVGTRDKLVPVAPSTNASNLIKPDNELMYRGMSADEMASFLRSQELKSRGDYNLSGQEGLTYFTKDPEAAEYYANAFAPEKYKPDMEKPAYLVAAKRPPSSRIVDVPGTASHELGVTGSVPVEDVVGVYRGTTTDYTPVWRDNGSYSAPNARLNWEEKSLDDILRGRASGGRIGYGPGGAIDDIVKMAGKIVSGADEPAKTGIRAYHSSPHDFDKFEWSPRTSGTGEGAQAYGAGLYFAESPKVSGRGGTYDKQFTRKLMELDRTGGDTRMSRLKIGNKPLTSYGVEYDPEFIDAVKSGRELDYAQNKLNRWHELSADEAYPYRDYAAEKMQAWEQLLNDMHSGKNAYYPTKSRIYEVEINADPNLLLRWDEPLKNQPPSVLKGLGFTNPEDVSALQKERSEIERRMGEKGWGNLPQSTNFDDFWKEVNNSVSENSEDYNRLMKINKELSNAGKDIPDITAGKFYKKNSERPENISLSLREQGVPGIQFWDGNSRNDPFLSQWRTDPEARWTTDAFPSEHEARQYLSSVWPGRDLSSLDERFGRVIKNPQATSNYVITDDSLIDIKKKYNRGGSADNNSVSGALNVARGLQGGM